MKTSFKYLIFLGAVSSFSCAKSLIIDTPKVSRAPLATSLNLDNACAGTQLQFRLSQDANQNNFQQSIEDFISAVFDPTELGTVSPSTADSTGVKVSMNLAFDANRQIISGSSQFKIVITDSLVGTLGSDGNPITAIQIAHDSSTQLKGRYAVDTAHLNLTFSDAYGSVVLDGVIKDSVLDGTLNFANVKAFDASSPRSGILGHFSAAGCNF